MPRASRWPDTTNEVDLTRRRHDHSVDGELDRAEPASAGTSIVRTSTERSASSRTARQCVDRYATPFGIRTIAVRQSKGFLLNGRPVKLQGVCLHHDLGALGAAVNRRATERQLADHEGHGRQRHPHQPQSALAGTARPLRPAGPGGHGRSVRHVAHAEGQERLLKVLRRVAERDLRDMHPPRPQSSQRHHVEHRQRDSRAGQCRRLADRQAPDRRSATRRIPRARPRRPSTSGPPPSRTGWPPQVDIPGFNYKPMHYARDPARASRLDHPRLRKPRPPSARAASITCRSRNTTKHPSLQLTSYDVIVPPWADLARRRVRRRRTNCPSVLGEFVWTGFDYLGEPTPYFMARAPNDWPSRSSYFGFVDLAGLPQRPLSTSTRAAGRQAHGPRPAALELAGMEGKRFRSWPTRTATKWSCS